MSKYCKGCKGGCNVVPKTDLTLSLEDIEGYLGEDESLDKLTFKPVHRRGAWYLDVIVNGTQHEVGKL